IFLAVGVPSGLEPFSQFGMMRQERVLTRAINDPARCRDMARQMIAEKCARMLQQCQELVSERLLITGDGGICAKRLNEARSVRHRSTFNRKRAFTPCILT